MDKLLFLLILDILTITGITGGILLYVIVYIMLVPELFEEIGSWSVLIATFWPVVLITTPVWLPVVLLIMYLRIRWPK